MNDETLLGLLFVIGKNFSSKNSSYSRGVLNDQEYNGAKTQPTLLTYGAAITCNNKLYNMYIEGSSPLYISC